MRRVLLFGAAVLVIAGMAAHFWPADASRLDSSGRAITVSTLAGATGTTKRLDMSKGGWADALFLRIATTAGVDTSVLNVVPAWNSTEEARRTVMSYAEANDSTRSTFPYSLTASDTVYLQVFWGAASESALAEVGGVVSGYLPPYVDLEFTDSDASGSLVVDFITLRRQ